METAEMHCQIRFLTSCTQVGSQEHTHVMHVARKIFYLPQETTLVPATRHDAMQKIMGLTESCKKKPMHLIYSQPNNNMECLPGANNIQNVGQERELPAMHIQQTTREKGISRSKEESFWIRTRACSPKTHNQSHMGFTSH
jgi:hypothetical protein